MTTHASMPIDRSAQRDPGVSPTELELLPGSTDTDGELLVTTSHEEWNDLCADLERWLMELRRPE